jgi:hypothetical protein
MRAASVPLKYRGFNFQQRRRNSTSSGGLRVVARLDSANSDQRSMVHVMALKTQDRRPGSRKSLELVHSREFMLSGQCPVIIMGYGYGCGVCRVQGPTN